MKGLSRSNKILPLIIFILGGILGYVILGSGDQKPQQNQQKEIKRVRTVETTQLQRTSAVPYWQTSGSVIVAEAVDINARVAGNIESINPSAIPGGFVQKGQWLAKLETVDYELSLKSQQAQLEQAKANLALALADRTLAQEELQLLGKSTELAVDQSLVLREPQLTVAKAKVDVEQANLNQAQLSLDRTTVIMPFDGKVITKPVGKGSKVLNNSLLFSVVNTNVYWLEVKIPHKFLKILDKKKTAILSQERIWGKGITREAKIISILPELDDKDRLVKVLLAIENPLSKNSILPPVFINDFLNVELRGESINNAWTIKHTWLQPDNTIWVVDKNNTLQKRPVEVLFKGRDVIYVNSEIMKGDKALAEKPSIASVGLVVTPRQSLLDTLTTKNSEKVKHQAKKIAMEPNHES